MFAGHRCADRRPEGARPVRGYADRDRRWFGRTPTVEITNAGKSKLGRDHNSAGFSMVLAGGVKGGTIYGATDEFGFQAAENPVHVHDLRDDLAPDEYDHERLTYRYASRDFRLTDVHGRVIRDIIS